MVMWTSIAHMTFYVSSNAYIWVHGRRIRAHIIYVTYLHPHSLREELLPIVCDVYSRVSALLSKAFDCRVCSACECFHVGGGSLCVYRKCDPELTFHLLPLRPAPDLRRWPVFSEVDLSSKLVLSRRFVLDAVLPSRGVPRDVCHR